jgi:hypothetical protein
LKVVGQVCVPDYPLNQPQAEIQIGECGTHWAICKVLCRIRAMELYPVHVWGLFAQDQKRDQWWDEYVTDIRDAKH